MAMRDGNPIARPERERKKILKLVREKYSGDETRRFEPTLAAEQSASEDQLQVHPGNAAALDASRGAVEQGAPTQATPENGASGGRISGSWCSWTAASTIGIRDEARGPV